MEGSSRQLVSHVPDELIDLELQRAQDALIGLTKRPVDLLTLKSLGADIDAVLIARNISKISPFVSTQLENQVVQALTAVPGADGLTWARQDPGFPDAGLVFNGVQTGHGIEAKAWYVCGTEITARFRASQVVLLGKRVYIVLVAWILSDIVFGTPTILDYELFDAADVARVRDEHYHQPINYLVAEPSDTVERTRNLQQANVTGFRLQTTDPKALTAGRILLGERDWEPPYTEQSRVITEHLLSTLTYREETNFGKLDRIDHPQIEAFKARILATDYRGRTVAAWTQVLRDLTSDNDITQKSALEVVASLYPDTLF
ncbi:MAG: hypothetical protein QOE05_472 [Actinomycetota bacterium]|nr:hypothetical protein [Actinomycetota bacterium]